MKNIIVISGKQYSGKDTLAKILLKKLPDFRRIGLGDAIKIEYGKKHNLSFEQIEKNKHLYRKDLIELGNWGRAQDKSYWLRNIMGLDKIIVPDIRMLFEAEYFKSQGAFLIRVNSTFENRSSRGVVTNGFDDTEVELDCFKGWNVVVNNDYDLDYLNSKSDEVLDLFLNFVNS